jgi:hypothetical protein
MITLHSQSSISVYGEGVEGEVGKHLNNLIFITRGTGVPACTCRHGGLHHVCKEIPKRLASLAGAAGGVPRETPPQTNYFRYGKW